MKTNPARVNNLSFPLGSVDQDGQLAWASEGQSVREVIWNILLTRPGERLMRPEFGAGLRDYLHRPNNQTTRKLIADVVQAAIRRWEPRIHLDEVNVSASPDKLNEITLSIRYRLRYDGSDDQMDLALTLG